LEPDYSVTHAAMPLKFGGMVAMKHTATMLNLPSLAIDVVKTTVQIDPALKGHSLLAGRS